MNSTMEQIDQWNLKPVESFLRSTSHSDWQSNVNTALADIERKQPSLSIEEKFKSLIQLDHKVGCVWSALSLFDLQHSTQAPDPDREAWLCEVSQKLIEQLDELSESIACHNEPLPELIRHWSASLQEEKQVTELINAYSAMNKASASSSCALLRRPQIDPEANALQYRLRQNGLTQASIAFTEAHAQESQAYFGTLSATSGLKSAWLSDIRQFEKAQYRIPEFDWADALACIGSIFESIHPICKTYVSDTINNGHIRRLENQCQPDMSIDTPFGSFVQLHFDGSLYGLSRMAHELGHAIHQRLHRESTVGVIALTDVESETWAMAIENSFLEQLMISRSEWAGQIDAFLRFQRIEMNHRHRMLTHFECLLYEHNIQDEAEINDLWLQVNHRFHGPDIRFDAEFQSAWKGVKHLYFAPFYLSVYAIAKERADRCDLRSMIQAYYSKKEVI